MQIQPAEVVLFQNLMALCATTEKDVFYFQDFPVTTTRELCTACSTIAWPRTLNS